MSTPMIDPRWGQPYGDTTYMTTEGVTVWLYRKGQRCRFFDAAAEQVGPEHRNVVPAIVWAAYEGWINPTALGLNLAVMREVRANTRLRT
jgi:hypothetical protein